MCLISVYNIYKVLVTILRVFTIILKSFLGSAISFRPRVLAGEAKAWASRHAPLARYLI